MHLFLASASFADFVSQSTHLLHFRHRFPIFTFKFFRPTSPSFLQLPSHFILSVCMRFTSSFRASSLCVFSIIIFPPPFISSCCLDFPQTLIYNHIVASISTRKGLCHVQLQLLLRSFRSSYCHV